MWWLLLIVYTYTNSTKQRTLHFFKLIDFYIIFRVLLTFCAHFVLFFQCCAVILHCIFSYDSDVSLTFRTMRWEKVRRYNVFNTMFQTLITKKTPLEINPVLNAHIWSPFSEYFILKNRETQ